MPCCTAVWKRDGRIRSGYICLPRDILWQVIFYTEVTVWDRSVLASGMTMYPQVLKNVIVTDKDETLNCPEVQDAVKKAEEELGDNGRVLLRKSGTEPLLRVMSEATTRELCEEKVDAIIAAMDRAGKLIRIK